MALPTETVYGLAANALDEKAVAAIFQAKGRPQDNPLIVHIASLEELSPLVREIPKEAAQLAEAFWPGPLTLVLPRSKRVPNIVTAGLDTVAVRFPSHPVIQQVIRQAGVPLAAPSANRSGRPSPTTAAHCMTDLEGRVPLILDGGPCTVGLESTVLSLAGAVPRLLRPGAVTPEALERVLGHLEIDPAVREKPKEGPVASPGMKYRHYAPKARVTALLGDWDACRDFLEKHQREGVWALVYEENQPTCPLPSLSLGREDDPSAHGQRLFGLLRELDERGATEVYARAPQEEGMGLAVYNRLIRAAGFRRVDLRKQSME